MNTAIVAPVEITVRGANLAGLATAARLARLGHRVRLVAAGQELGGRWAPHVGPGGHMVDALPQTITLPASWRDLFKKSGGHLQAELNRSGLEMVPAPAAEHLFPDGRRIALPTSRGERHQAISSVFGAEAAGRWRKFSDGLDDLWAAWRRHALEGLAPATSKEQRSALWLDRTLADIASDLGPDLGCLVTSLSDSPESPGVLAVGIHVEQLFGRWELVDVDGNQQRASLLVDLLLERIHQRGVTIVAELADDTTADVDCLPHLPAPKRTKWWKRATALTPAQAPRTTHELAETAPGPLPEVVDHTGSHPVITWRRPVDGGMLVTIRDHNHTTADLGWGTAIPSAQSWLDKPGIDDDGTLRAATTSPAGAEPWAELGSAALAVYELHERLTGEDSRPTNKDFQMPRF